ncbi:MAG: 5'-methylthioadenosine/S-adenosylhomocysteine nucleosidase [Sarcina sp.]
MFEFGKKKNIFRNKNTIGVIATIELEIQKIKSFVDIISEEKYAGLKFYMVKYKQLDVVLVNSAQGKVNVASCTQILIDKFNVCKIINSGFAGALINSINISDIIIIDEVTYHDVTKMQMQNTFPFKDNFKSDKKLIDIAVQAYNNLNSVNLSCCIGKCVTGESFISDKELKEIILDDYDCKCVDMECAAIAHVADINNIPFIVIKSISDRADENASENYIEFEEFITNNLSSIVINILEIISKTS